MSREGETKQWGDSLNGISAFLLLLEKRTWLVALFANKLSSPDLHEHAGPVP